MKKLMYVMLCVGLGLVLCGTAQAANSLLNPSFNPVEGGGGGAAAANWTETLVPPNNDGSATGVEQWAGHFGYPDWGMAVYWWNNGGNGGFYQDVAVTAGASYGYTIYATRDAGVLAGSIAMTIEWYGDELLGTTSKDITNLIGVEEWPNPNWVNVFLAGEAPTGADVARVMISATGVTKALKFDDASFVPEPATMTILALGSLFLARRRK
jgi:hypothetical protein